MPDAAQSWAFLENSDLIASAAEVEAAVQRVAAEIDRAFSEKYPLVLAVMGGAVVFAGQILPRLRFPLDFDYVHASRYGAATRGAGIQWRVRPPELVKGRAVLVLDDILDHGETMHAIRNGFGHGLVHLWAEDGTLLATASQSCIVRYWKDVS